MRLLLAVIALACFTGNTSAQHKCTTGKKVLYTDTPCPIGSQTSSTAGNVSTIDTNTRTEAINREFLRQRAEEDRQFKAQIFQEQAQQIALDRSQCNALTAQARSIEAAMRQPLDYSMQERYRKDHKSIRDQQYRLKC